MKGLFAAAIFLFAGAFFVYFFGGVIYYAFFADSVLDVFVYAAE